MAYFIIVARTAVATQIIEYLNTWENLKFEHTEPTMFDTREIAVFLVSGEPADLQTIYDYCNHAYTSSSVVALYFLKQKEVKQIGG